MNKKKNTYMNIYMNFREWLWCVLSAEMAFEAFTPTWSHVNANEKKKKKKNPQESKFLISQFFE